MPSAIIPGAPLSDSDSGIQDTFDISDETAMNECESLYSDYDYYTKMLENLHQTLILKQDEQVRLKCTPGDDRPECESIQKEIDEIIRMIDEYTSLMVQTGELINSICLENPSAGWSSRESICVGSRPMMGTVPELYNMSRMGPPANRDGWHCFTGSKHLNRWFSSPTTGDEWSCDRSIFATLQWGTSNNSGYPWAPNVEDPPIVVLNQFSMKVLLSNCEGRQILDNEDCNPMGCTDSSACNYNPNASMDDGSCFYGSTCWDGSSTCNDPCSENGCPEPFAPSFGSNYPLGTSEDYNLVIDLFGMGA